MTERAITYLENGKRKASLEFANKILAALGVEMVVGSKEENKMKWTNEQVEKLKKMCYAGTSNAELAKEFGVPVTEIHAKRSALGITRAKCVAGQPAGQRAAETIEEEILKVRNARKDAEHKIKRADDRMTELYNELYDALLAKVRENKS